MTAPALDEGAAPIWRRFVLYLGERFPVAKHGVLIAAFGASAVCLSAMLRGDGATPSLHAIGVAVAVLFLLFFQLRVADEHKDFDEDARFRPERAVPRGLVSLGELRIAAIGAAAVQMALTASLHPPLLIFLFAAWGWMALMSAEFFAPVWLKARPIVYMVSHMAVMPLIDLYATATDWLPAGGKPEQFALPLGLFLALSFVNGVVVEVARKSWAPADEREGVETYSKLWGVRGAAWTLAAMLALGLGVSVGVNLLSGAPVHYAVLLGAAAGFAIVTALRYAASPTRAAAGRMEAGAGVFVLVNYLALGVLPMGERLWLS